MISKRVVWRESSVPKEYKPIRHRKFLCWGTPDGWEVSIPGDYNLYANHYCAQNAIDQYYGDFGQHGTEKRIKNGIRIVGKKSKQRLK